LAPESTVPEVISDLKVWSRAGGVYLRWTVPAKNIDGSKLKDLSGFKIWRQARPLTPSPCPECPLKFEPVGEIDVAFPRGARIGGGVVLWQDPAVKPQNEYTYFVQSYNSDRFLSPGSNRVKIFWDDPPAAPIQVSLRKEDRALEVLWEFPPHLLSGRTMVDQKGFNLYRRGEGEPFGFFPLNNEPLGDRRYRDGMVELGKRYYYEIRVVRSFHGSLLEGPGSAVIAGVPEKLIPPVPPTGLVAVWQKEGVALRWNENSEADVTGYDLYRREKEEKEFRKINSQPIVEPYFLDPSANPQKTYDYCLKALDSSGKESDFSQPFELAPGS